MENTQRGVQSFKKREIECQVDSSYEYSPWTDSTETISRLDRISSLFVVIYIENFNDYKVHLTQMSATV